jgi:hypothetical protein
MKFFHGKNSNTELPELLRASNFTLVCQSLSISMLFEAMASNCYPIVTNIAGNQSWITHQNGHSSHEICAMWAFENSAFRKNPFCITENLSKKMPLQNQHENNRKQISRIN